MYDVFLYVDETGLAMYEIENFGGDCCAGNENLGTDAVSETIPGDGAGWGVTNVYCGVNFDENVG